MSGPIFVALVNPKSGGNLGQQLLSRFKEILKHDRVYNLADDEHPGPAKALEDHKNEENLRLIGMLVFQDVYLSNSTGLQFKSKCVLFKNQIWPILKSKL